MRDSESAGVPRRAGWPAVEQHGLEAWIEGRRERVEAKGDLPLHPILVEFQQLIDTDPGPGQVAYCSSNPATLKETPMSTTDTRDLGLLALRLGLGGTLAAHGTQKLFGWFGGHGLEGTGAFFESIGFTPGRPNAILAGLGEAGGGVLLALGLATPAGGAAAAGTMAVAATMHKDKGFFAQDGGYEYPLMLGVAAAALALGGPGQLSLDAALGHRANRHWMRMLGLASIPAAVALVTRRRQANLAATGQHAATQSTSSELPQPTEGD